MVGQGAHTIKIQAHKAELGQRGRGFVAELRQSQTGDKGQQGAICHGARIVVGLGLAAKGKGHGLGLRAFGQIVGAVPGCRHGQRQQQSKRYADQPQRHVGVGCELEHPGAQPVGQQRVVFRGNTQQRGVPPIRAARSQLRHKAQRRHVGTLPAAAPYKAGQHIDDTQAQQRRAWQAFDSGLGYNGGGGDLHYLKASIKKAARKTGLLFWGINRTRARCDLTWRR